MSNLVSLAASCVIASSLVAASPVAGDEWFAPAQSVAAYRPKGPTHCFRQFNIDWSWIALRPSQIPEFLSQARPAEFAEFCQQSHVDGTVVMAVPHHGYCTHQTKVGVKFPGMKGDWFGETIEELHKRRIAAFGYVTLNWNWKYMRENLGRDFIHGQPDPNGVFSSRGLICFNAPGYLELVEAYTREVLERYPVDGMRWDILFCAKRCTCAGCKELFRRMYGQELTRWKDFDERRQMDFYLATTRRVVERLHALCKQIKPSVEIWQNCIQSYHDNDLNIGRELDIAYNEYGDPFRLLFLRGVLAKPAAINGLMNHTPPGKPLESAAFRMCLALGGRCYSYYGHKQTDHRRLLPDESMTAWHRDQLAPFYQMVAQIEPWLIGAQPVSHVAVVYSENTRYRYKGYKRDEYINPIQKLTEVCLARSLPLEFVNTLDLSRAAEPGRFKLLVLPQTSGLNEAELSLLRRYAEQGGTVLLAGDVLRHDQEGQSQKDFALAPEMGVQFEQAEVRCEKGETSGRLSNGEPVQIAKIARLVRVRTQQGKTLLVVKQGGESLPLLHVNALGKGRIAYLASLDSTELTQTVIDDLAGPPPVSVQSAEPRQVILTAQPDQHRWVLHLISDGDYTVDLPREYVGASRVIDQYPATGWSHQVERTPAGLRIHVRGGSVNRLLVVK